MTGKQALVILQKWNEECTMMTGARNHRAGVALGVLQRHLDALEELAVAHEVRKDVRATPSTPSITTAICTKASPERVAVGVRCASALRRCLAFGRAMAKGQ